MIFANPFGLIGLLSLPAILALHLIRERQRRFVVSDLSLWSFLDDAVRGPQPQRLPLTWLLLLDLAAAALFSLAWSQPRLHLALPISNARHQVILLDISSSMSAQDGLSSRLSAAKTDAIALVNRAGPGDRITVLAFGSKPHWVGDSRQETRAQLVERIEELQAGETGHALQETIALGLSAVDKTLQVQFHILTDGAFPEQDTARLNNLGYPAAWHIYNNQDGNQAVLDLNATPLGENRYQVFARIGNFDNRWATRSITLLSDGKPVGKSWLEIPADSTVPQVWQISGKYMSLSVALNGSDSFKEDDTAAIGLQAHANIHVVLVADNPSPLQQAFQAIPNVDLQVIPSKEYNRTGPQDKPDLTVFRGFIPDNLPGGKVLVVDPPEGQSPAAGLAFGGRRDIPAGAPLQFPTQDPLLAGVDFGGVRWTKAWSLASIPEGFSVLLQAGDAPLLLAGGQRWVLLADLGQGNFTRHPAFPILMANLVQQVDKQPLPASVKTGQALALPPAGQFQSLRVSAPEESPAVFQDNWPTSWEKTLSPGLYRFTFTSQAGGNTEYLSGVNAGDETESDLRPRAWVNDLPDSISDSGTQNFPEDQNQGWIDLLPWLLASALIVILLEATLAWR